MRQGGAGVTGSGCAQSVYRIAAGPDLMRRSNCSYQSGRAVGQSRSTTSRPLPRRPGAPQPVTPGRRRPRPTPPDRNRQPNPGARGRDRAPRRYRPRSGGRGRCHGSGSARRHPTARRAACLPARAARPHPDRDRPAFRGGGGEADRADVVMLAVELGDFAAPQAGDQVESLVEHRRPGPVVGRVAEQAEVAVSGRTQADAEYGPAPGQQVERDGLARQHPRPAPRDGRDHGADHQPLGTGGDDREHRPRVHDRRAEAVVGPGDVVPQEEAVEPGLLRLDGQADKVGGIVSEAGSRDRPADAHRPWRPKRAACGREENMLSAFLIGA